MSTSDIYKCQIMTSEVGPHSERFKPFNCQIIQSEFSPSENYSGLTKWRSTVSKYC